MRTLVLNAGFEPMLFVSWQRALCLVFSDKAEVVAHYNDTIRTVNQSFPMPSVVRLTSYIRVVRRFSFVRCTRRNVMLRDRYRCQYCGVQCSTKTASIDHITPRAFGGQTTWDNVTTACQSCNRRKGSRSIAQAGMSLLTKPRQPTWVELMGEFEDRVEETWLPFIDLTA